MATVGAVSVLRPDIAFLWHNVIGAVAVVVVGLLLSLGGRTPEETAISIVGEIIAKRNNRAAAPLGSTDGAIH